MKKIILSAIAALGAMISQPAFAETYGPFTVEPMNENACTVSIQNARGIFIMSLDVEANVAISGARPGLVKKHESATAATIAFDQKVATFTGISYYDGTLGGVFVDLGEAEPVFSLILESESVVLSVPEGRVVGITVDENFIISLVALVECTEGLATKYDT